METLLAFISAWFGNLLATNLAADSNKCYVYRRRRAAFNAKINFENYQFYTMLNPSSKFKLFTKKQLTINIFCSGIKVKKNVMVILLKFWFSDLSCEHWFWWAYHFLVRKSGGEGKKKISAPIFVCSTKPIYHSTWKNRVLTQLIDSLITYVSHNLPHSRFLWFFYQTLNPSVSFRVRVTSRNLLWILLKGLYLLIKPSEPDVVDKIA